MKSNRRWFEILELDWFDLNLNYSHTSKICIIKRIVIQTDNNLPQWVIESNEAELNESKLTKPKQIGSNLPTKIKKRDTKVIGPKWYVTLSIGQKVSPINFTTRITFEWEIPVASSLIRSASQFHHSSYVNHFCSACVAPISTLSFCLVHVIYLECWSSELRARSYPDQRHFIYRNYQSGVSFFSICHNLSRFLIFRPSSQISP